MNMDINYLIILDYSYGELIKIKLTDEEKRQLDEHEDFESFIYTLEEKYEFKVSDCLWMTCEKLSERTFNTK